MYVKEHFQVESTNTLLMVALDALSISVVCSSEPDLGVMASSDGLLCSKPPSLQGLPQPWSLCGLPASRLPLSSQRPPSVPYSSSVTRKKGIEVRTPLLTTPLSGLTPQASSVHGSLNAHG